MQTVVLLLAGSLCFLLGHEALPILFKYVPPYYTVPIPPPYPGPVFLPKYVAGPHTLSAEGIQSENMANYYDTGKVMSTYNVNDAVNKNIQDTQQSAALGTVTTTGDHKVVSDNVENHGYQHGLTGKSGKSYGKKFEGGSKEYDLESNDGYGNLGGSGFNKGHKTTGFHKSYHNIEEGKESNYIDEDHKFGEEGYGQKYEDLYGNKGYQGFDTKHLGEDYHSETEGNSGARSGLNSIGIQDAKFEKHGKKEHYNTEGSGSKSSLVKNYEDNELAAGGSRTGINAHLRSYPHPPLYSY